MSPRTLILLAAAATWVLACGTRHPGSAPAPTPGPSPTPTSECATGDVLERTCGLCGRTSRTCAAGAWGAWSPCTGEGVCAPGTPGTERCGSDVGACVKGTRTRTCGDSCQWGAWSACAGAVAPVPEVCGNGVDENCDGVADEGCTCHAAAPGAGGSFLVTATLAKLVADPTRCRVYGLHTGLASEIVVFDTAGKAELTRVALPEAADDLDVSSDGARLVVAHAAAQKVSVVDLERLAVTATVAVGGAPMAVEVDRSGRAFYAAPDSWMQLRTLDPAAAASTDRLLGSVLASEVDLELSPDGSSLLIGQAGSSGSKVYRFRVGGGAWVQEDVCTWRDGSGFVTPERHLFLSPGGQHLWYAGYQFDPLHLATVNGRTGERVFAEDRAGTFAVGESTVWDAALVSPISTLAVPISAAALASDDTELWTWTSSTSRISYVNAADVLGGGARGDRSPSPGTLASYGLTRLVADPVRPRLYGLDPARRVVVAIDTATLAPVGAVAVGATPTDLAIAPSGAALYVGDLDATAVARIDLASFRFDRFVYTPDPPYEVEVLSGGRLATIDQDQFTTLTILDEATGAVEHHARGFYEAALAATADGEALLVAESDLSGSNIFRFDVTRSPPVQVAKSTFMNGYGFFLPARTALPTPDGRAVYYASYLLEGTHLTSLVYPQPDPIRAVTSDGALATSSTKVYRVSDGYALGTLPVAGEVQAAGPGGKTVYVYAGAAIVKVDLSGY